MRQIILDTETSGLDFEKDRIIEIGCLELIDGVYTGKKYHRYYRPDNILISQESQNIHGLDNEFLSKFESFDRKIEDFLLFINNSQMIIHNAQFDLNMINQSLKNSSFLLFKASFSISVQCVFIFGSPPFLIDSIHNK